MSQQHANFTHKRQHGRIRRGAVVVYVAICLTVIIGFAALAVDIGMLYATHAEMQRAADSAAMAAAWELLSEERLMDGDYEEEVCQLARESAAYAASCNPVLQSEPMVVPDEDVDIGYLSDLTYG
ncbi:MAG: hypothetical protein KKI02_01865, partial [Planctomycetes bacterium]|nr:hypothetical protein [Planctomycetota bacterium]